MRWRLDIWIDLAGGISRESRGLARLICEPIGHRRPSGSCDMNRKSLRGSGPGVSGASTRGDPLLHRPTIFAAKSSLLFRSTAPFESLDPSSLHALTSSTL